MSKTAIYPEPVCRTVEGGGYSSVNVLIFNGHWKLCPKELVSGGSTPKSHFVIWGLGRGDPKFPLPIPLNPHPFQCWLMPLLLLFNCNAPIN